MPRTLPWLANAPGVKPNPNRSSSPPAPKRRKRSPSPEEDLVNSDLDDIATPPPRPRQQQERDPSTSPAGPKSPDAPPAVEYMLPGKDADDKWLIVEDEFYDTAKLFTRHLHISEATRITKLNKSRGEKTLGNIKHGTDGRTGKSKGVQLREAGDAIEKRKQDALDEGDDTHDAYWRDPQLAGLMGREKDRRVGRQLAGMVKAKSNTRAAAGLMESPYKSRRSRDVWKEEDDGDMGKVDNAKGGKLRKVFEDVFDEEGDDDDLDARPKSVAPSRKPERKDKPRFSSSDDRSPTLERDDAESSNVFKRFAAPSKESRPSKERHKTSSTQIKVEDDIDTFNLPRPKPFRPTYKKALNRQASRAQALASQDADKASRSPSKPTGTFKPTVSRASVSSSTMTGSSSPTKKSPSASAMTEWQYGRHEANATGSSYLAKRKADREKREKEQQKKGAGGKRVDDIPTFLF